MPFGRHGAYDLGDIMLWCGERGLCSCGETGGDPWLKDGRRDMPGCIPDPGGDCGENIPGDNNASAPIWSFKEGRLMPTLGSELGDIFWMGARLSCPRLKVGEAKEPVLGVLYMALPGLYGGGITDTG
jgi:hypothetical protein